MERTYRIGARTSHLALKQVGEVIGLLKVIYPKLKYEIIGIDTYGDKDKITPISDIEGTDFFTREIEEKLLKGEIDFAVHSAKDLPDILPKGLVIAAITKAGDPYDALVSKGNLKIGQLPRGAKIGTSSQGRKTQLKKYREDFQLLDLRGNIEERLEKLDTDSLDAIVVAACALIRLGLESRITQRVPFEILRPHPLQGALAIEAREDNQELRDLLKVLNPKSEKSETVSIPKRKLFPSQSGQRGLKIPLSRTNPKQFPEQLGNSFKVYLVGAGPGSPDLITVRALEILREADTVIYDYLVDKRILAEAKEGAELICCDTLGKKRYSDGFLRHNDKVNKIVIKKFKEGRKVIRLKNGDVSIFSRASQELEPLVKNKIPFELVPGVTAASGASCFSGIPLTDRRYASDCAFVTGHEDQKKTGSALDWAALSKIGTLIFYMAVENLPKIAQELIKEGKSAVTPVAVIQEATLLTQKVIKGTLSDIAKKVKFAKIRSPGIIIIGEVVKLEKDFNWLRKTKRILFTGISKERFFQGGFVYHLPLIKIVPLEDYREFDEQLLDIADYDWILLASRYGVEYFFKRLNKIGLDARSFKEAKIAAIGDSTRNRLLDFGIVADLVPKEESSLGLIKEFKKIDIRHKRIFMPRSDISDKGLESALEKLGAQVASGFAYKNIMPQDLPDLDLDNFDEIIFTSPSGVRNFIKRYKKLPKQVKVSCIGEVTKKEAKRSGLVDS